VASSRDRQRKLARAKLDRQMARRAAAARRKRRIQASFGVGVAAAVVVVTSVWAAGGFDRDPDEIVAEPDVCLWTPLETEGNPDLRDVGTPATTGLPTSGTRTMTIATDQGDPITVSLDLASAPCAGASFAHLAEKKFFDNTKCHEITEEGALRCGDPTGTGRGGPTYSFLNENIPSPPRPGRQPTRQQR
jgi:peptidyl-prolyl cis-trans isomerase B (cyclophilin B)